MSEKGSCIIVCAGDVSADILPQKRDGDLLIAVDAGYKILLDADIPPDVFVGDGDSLGFIPDEREVLVLPKIKDDTDTIAAVKLALSRGYRRIDIYGALGGRRFSHSVANIQTLMYIDEKGCEGVIVDKRCTCRILSQNVTPEFRIRQSGGYFSLFAVGGDVVVTVQGAKYEIEDRKVSPSFPLGVSNEPENDCTVKIRSGRALLVCER